MKYETRSKNCYCVQCGGWAAPRPPNHRKDQGLAAVVSGYRSASAPVRDQENRDTEFHLRENTGIVVAYDVNEAIALIRANPKGLATGKESLAG